MTAIKNGNENDGHAEFKYMWPAFFNPIKSGFGEIFHPIKTYYVEIFDRLKTSYVDILHTSLQGQADAFIFSAVISSAKHVVIDYLPRPVQKYLDSFLFFFCNAKIPHWPQDGIFIISLRGFVACLTFSFFYVTARTFLVQSSFSVVLNIFLVAGITYKSWNSGTFGKLCFYVFYDYVFIIFACLEDWMIPLILASNFSFFFHLYLFGFGFLQARGLDGQQLFSVGSMIELVGCLLLLMELGALVFQLGVFDHSLEQYAASVAFEYGFPGWQAAIEERIEKLAMQVKETKDFVALWTVVFFLVIYFARLPAGVRE
jgi:hypothetical protein